MASALERPSLISPETVDPKDRLSLETVSIKKELEVVETALSRILQEENPRPAPEQELRKAELCRRLHGSASSKSSDDFVKSGESGLDRKDLMLLSKLLNQVRQSNMEYKWDDCSPEELSPMETGDFQKSYSKHPRVAEENALSQSENIVDNVVGVASAAAEAAKAAATAAAKNVEIMEALFKSKKSKLHHENMNESSETSQEDCSDASPGMDEKTKEVVKRVEKQNRITHWVLGIMMVTTFIWRFKILSMIFDVTNTISNPVQALGGMFDGFKGPSGDEVNGAKPFDKARTVIPSLLQERGNDMAEKIEKAKSEDSKVGDGLAHSLDNILNGGSE